MKRVFRTLGQAVWGVRWVIALMIIADVIVIWMGVSCG